MLYRWSGTSFEQFQPFGERGGRAFAFFTADRDAYLAFADLERESALYRWNGRSCVPHQLLEGPGGRAFAFVAGRLGYYLIRVNFVTGSRAAPTTALRSQVYRWERGRLAAVDELATFGASDIACFRVGEQLLVAVTNSLSEDVRFRVDSVVYRFLG